MVYPPDNKPLGCKWILKRKLKYDESIEKYKIGNKGLKTKIRHGLFNTLSSLTIITTIILLVLIVALYNLDIYLSDVRTTS